MRNGIFVKCLHEMLTHNTVGQYESVSINPKEKLSSKMTVK